MTYLFNFFLPVHLLLGVVIIISMDFLLPWIDLKHLWLQHHELAATTSNSWCRSIPFFFSIKKKVFPPFSREQKYLNFSNIYQI